MSPNLLVATLLGLYLLVGLGVAGRLNQLGYPGLTAASAMVAWPLLWSATSTAPSGLAPGPHHARIQACLEALARTVREEPAASTVVGPAELDSLRRSLFRADARIAAVDHLLNEPGLSDEPGVQALRQARNRASDQVEAVLAGVLQLRVQVGLLALAGDTAGVRARLGDLSSRVAALEELEAGTLLTNARS